MLSYTSDKPFVTTGSDNVMSESFKLPFNLTWRTVLILTIASFFLNFFWEMWQMPFFTFNGENDYWRMNWVCTKASIGDAVISLISFLVTAWVSKDVSWYRLPNMNFITIYLLVGIGITVVLEWINTAVLFNWEYKDTMPVVPVLGTGLTPILQWIIIPLLILFILNRLTIHEFDKDEI